MSFRKMFCSRILLKTTSLKTTIGSWNVLSQRLCGAETLIINKASYLLEEVSCYGLDCVCLDLTRIFLLLYSLMSDHWVLMVC